MPEPPIGLRLDVALAPDADAAEVARRPSRSVKIDGDALELTNASREDPRRLVASFVAGDSP